HPRYTPGDIRYLPAVQPNYGNAPNQLPKGWRGISEGYLVRHAPAADVAALRQLAGHLRGGLFVTNVRRTFPRAGMNEDLLIVPARLGDREDSSEYEERLPTSPP